MTSADANTNISENEAPHEINLERILNAPIEKVFEAWSKLENLEKWWGPDGFTTATEIFDFKEGGTWVYTMTGPDGTVFPNRMNFIKIVPGQCIVNNHDRGEDVPDDPHSFETTVLFDPLGDKTRIKMNHVFKNQEARDYIQNNFKAREGGEQHLKNCEDFVVAKG